ncbi:MAG TPA: hypothetical protein DIW44_09890 [Anaerolineaceae bacterium]|nr:hypothetical protein [Anaerolineaceae bacterium]
MEQPKKISRRSFIKGVAILTVAGAVTGTGVWATSTPAYPSADTNINQEKNMDKKILVAYASKCGSTAEVAKTIGQLLSESGVEVEVRAAHEVRKMEDYDAVVMGTAIRMGRPLGEMTNFAKKFNKDLAKLPTALFSVGLSMKEDTAENRAETAKFIAPLVEQLPSKKSTAMFGGKVDYKTLSPLLSFMLSKDTSGEMAEGDYRDWNTINAWANSLPAELGLG